MVFFTQLCWRYRGVSLLPVAGRSGELFTVWSMQTQRPSSPGEDTDACKLTFPAKISGKSSQPELSAVWITVWEEALGAGEEEGNGDCELINGVARQGFNVYFLLFVLWHKASTLSMEGPGPLHPFLRKTSRVGNIFWIAAKQIRQACLMPEFGSWGRLILDRGHFSLELIMGGLHRWALFHYLMSKWSLSCFILLLLSVHLCYPSQTRMSLPDWKGCEALLHVTEEPPVHSSSTGSYCKTFLPPSGATSDLFRWDR